MKGSNLTRTAAAAALAAALAGDAAWVFAQAPGTDNQAERLAPIVVTATRMEEKVSEQASAVSVVTREEIERKSPFVAGDLLQGLPGVDVQRSGSPGGRENVKLRGSLGTHTLVLIDGFPVNSPTAAEFDIGTLPVDGFERIEVVRGAQSALYGSNAMGGVVNFVPGRVEEGRQYGLKAAGGSHDTLKWSGFAQARGKGGGVHLGLGGFDSGGVLRNDDASLVSFIGTGDLPVGTRNRLHAVAFSTDSDKGIPIDFTGSDLNHRTVRRGFLRGARWESDLSKAVSLEASAAEYEEFLRDDDPADPGEFFPVEFTIRTRKTSYRLLGRYAPSAVSATFVGAEYVKDRGTDRDNFGLDLARSTFNRAVFLQQEFRPATSAGVSLGARLDRNSEAGTEFNPKAAACYEFERMRTRVRAAVGRGFRVPTIVELFDPFVGNPGLVSESVRSYEAGADVRLAEGATVAATWFYQDFDDLIQFVPTGPFTGELRNVGRAFSRGLEAEAAFRLLPEVELDLAGTWTDTRDSASGGPVLGIPDRRGVASLLLFPAPGWEGQIDWRVESDQADVSPAFQVVRRPGYGRVDAYATYRWDVQNAGIRQVAVTGKVRNVLDREYDERAGIPAPGITFLLGAEFRI